ncbi:MAG: PKD domain-containing protein [Saprospiraceae bacterium]
MKKLIKFSIGVLLPCITILLSCKKDIVALGELNKPPKANAGPDQTIILPKDSISLDGSASVDPDGRISKWLWTKISGPASFNIIHASDSVTVVRRLTAGTYQFELKVTDNGGLSAKDTLRVVVDSFFMANHPPKANAGNDTTIILPSSSVTLDGSRSTDPDNNISSYVWTKISGPSSFNISNAGGIQTQVVNLVEGIYQVELKVTDAGGLFSKDTMKVIVSFQPPACDNSNRPQITSQLIPLGSLSQIRVGMVVASAGNKILFAGGINGDLNSARVDIYDINTQIWTTAELSIARYSMAAVAAGNRIFFGGGEIGDGTEPVNTVDIYDVSTNTWSVTTLSAAGNGIAATTTGNKVFFAGGDPGYSGVSGYDHSSKVDIYDLVTGTWSTASLSEGKTALSAVATNNKVYFAGGATRINNSSNNYTVFNSILIDIYDNATNTWTTSFLQEGK